MPKLPELGETATVLIKMIISLELLADINNIIAKASPKSRIKMNNFTVNFIINYLNLDLSFKSLLN